MKAMKKTIAVLLTLCMVVSMLAVAAVSVSAEETGLSEGYYLVGKIGGVDTWYAKAENRLTVNTGNTDEYMIENVSLDAEDQIKVAHYDGKEINVWYPDGMDNQYDITADGKYTMTVAALANEYIAGDYSDNAKALAKAILVYGAAAQKQFSFRGDDLAAQDTPAEYAADDIKTYDDGAVNVPDKTQMPNLSAYGLNYEGSTLLLQSTTSLRFYFTKTDAFDDDVNVTYGDYQLELQQYGTGKYWYVEISDMGANMLDNAQMLSVTDGKDKTDLGEYSTLSYVKAALGGTDDTLKNTVRAFYGFYLAAQKYQRENVINY